VNIKQNQMAASSRFVNVSDEEISEIKSSAVPKTTQNATKYGVKLFKGMSASSVGLIILL